MNSVKSAEVLTFADFPFCMGRRHINRQILSLAGPSILANITVPLVGIVDLAIAGHVGDAACMGGIAIGSMLFDLLYWNLSFLRVGTGGFTAQAYGRKDRQGMVDTFSQGIATSLGAATLCLLVQWLFVEVAFRLIDCTPEVEAVARDYFFIRIWAAPATISLFVFKGWFIGMQNTVFSMIVDVWVNVVNIIASWLLAFHTPMGINGVAAGTLVAQWSGLAVATILLFCRYSDLLKCFSLRRSIRWKYIKTFFSVNLDLFIRSLSFLVIYSGFTAIAAKYGDVQLAVSSVMMKMLLLYSYFIDGFAYAGEALTGRYIGERDSASLKWVIRLIFLWAFIISIISTAAYLFFPRTIISVITNDAQVLDACGPFLFWLLLMPVFSCIAFTWDGIYIGATASAPMRNCMLAAAACFVLTYFLCRGHFGIQSIYIAYFAHLVVRSVWLTLVFRPNILARIAPKEA